MRLNKHKHVNNDMHSNNQASCTDQQARSTINQSLTHTNTAGVIGNQSSSLASTDSMGKTNTAHATNTSPLTNQSSSLASTDSMGKTNTGLATNQASTYNPSPLTHQMNHGINQTIPTGGGA